MFGRPFKNEELPSSEPAANYQDSEYNGEWYVLAMSSEEYGRFRTEEKGYSMLASILQVLLGFLPSMGLNLIYTAAAYVITLALMLWQTWVAYHGPDHLEPMSYDKYKKYNRLPLRLSSATRILTVLTFILNVIAVIHWKLGFNLWIFLQCLLLLANAYLMQQLYRKQRSVRFDVVSRKPEKQEEL